MQLGLFNQPAEGPTWEEIPSVATLHFAYVHQGVECAGKCRGRGDISKAALLDCKRQADEVAQDWWPVAFNTYGVGPQGRAWWSWSLENDWCNPCPEWLVCAGMAA